MTVLEYALPLIIIVMLAFPLGLYIAKVMNPATVLPRFFHRVESFLYKMMGVNREEEMDWKKYLAGVLVLSLFSFVVLFAMCMLQGYLPGNPNGAENMSWDLAFNTAISFVTNTNWQSYSGEAQMSYLTQALGLTVQNFLSAAIGISVMFAVVRGFARKNTRVLGNFWVDITRITLYVLLPLSFVLSIILISQGVVQSGSGNILVQLLEPIVIDSSGNAVVGANVIDGVAYLNGVVLENISIITKTFVPQGLAASQIAIKMLGTNGGGFFGANSAFPLENPNWLSNLLEMVSILLIPCALVFSFGREVKDQKQGRALFLTMGIMIIGALIVVACFEHIGVSIINDNESILSIFGNIEGKEMRFGTSNSVIWAVFTTAASNGSVNAMHDSFTSMGGLVLMALMQIGEIVFGGVGSGMYGMLAFVIMTVFIAGLMVGRTPEYLGKKIEPNEMRWSVIAVLATPVAILVGSGIAVLVPDISQYLTNSGPHGFSEILYAFSSAGANNGSAFAGLMSDTTFLNLSLGLCMVFGRFVPIVAMLKVADGLSIKKRIATTSGTLSTTSPMFVFLLITIIFLVGALSFFPAWSLGPIAEYFQ